MAKEPIASVAEPEAPVVETPVVEAPVSDIPPAPTPIEGLGKRRTDGGAKLESGNVRYDA